MDTSPLISIIVPVYNVENYLERCIINLISQTYGNIEIILVDDGSQDKCPAICDEYAQQDKRVISVHKANGGLSDARNYGLKLAKGKYVLFVDSDDYIEKDSCERFADIVHSNEVDIVVADAKKICGHKFSFMKQVNISPNRVYSGKEFLKKQIINRCCYIVVWTNLYRRDFLLQHSLFFKAGILFEDEQWTPRVFLNANKIVYLDYPFYNYIIRSNSITSNKGNNLKIARDMISTCYELYALYDTVDDITLKRILKDMLCTKYLYVCYLARLNRKDNKELINKKFVLVTPYYIKTKLKAYLFCFNISLYYFINGVHKALFMRR